MGKCNLFISLGDGQFKYHNVEQTDLLRRRYEIHHAHRHYEIAQVLVGEVTFVVNGKSYDAHPGDIILIRRNDFHVVKPTGDKYFRRVIEFDPTFFRAAPAISERLMAPFNPKDALFNNFAPAEIIERSQVNALFDKIEACIRSHPDDVEILLMVHLMELLIELNHVFSVQSPRLPAANPIVQSTINYVDAHIGERMPLCDIGKEVNVSPFYLSRTFKRVMGITLHEYVIEKKIFHAERLIESGITPTEAAAAVCYDYPNFYLNYKRILKKSPKDSRPR